MDVKPQSPSLCIAVTGGRHLGMTYSEAEGWTYSGAAVRAVCHALEHLWVTAGGAQRDVVVMMLNGGCPTGLDAIARDWCEVKDVHYKLYLPDWSLGKKAGPLRNQRMIDDADILLAFPGGRGTADCVRRAERKRISVITAIGLCNEAAP